MAYTITVVNPHMLRVDITIPQDEVDRAIDAEYKLFARTPRLRSRPGIGPRGKRTIVQDPPVPGWRTPRGSKRSRRRGKRSALPSVPRDLLEARHGLEVLRPLCLKMMRDRFQKIRKEHNLDHVRFLRARAHSVWFGGGPLEYEVSFYHRPILRSLVPDGKPYDWWELPIGFKFWQDGRNAKWASRDSNWEEAHGEEEDVGLAGVSVPAGKRGADSSGHPAGGKENPGGDCAAEKGAAL